MFQKSVRDEERRLYHKVVHPSSSDHIWRYCRRGINNYIEEYLPVWKKKENRLDKIKDEYTKYAKEIDDDTYESILAVKDVPLGILLNKVYETETS